MVGDPLDSSAETAARHKRVAPSTAVGELSFSDIPWIWVWGRQFSSVTTGVTRGCCAHLTGPRGGCRRYEGSGLLGAKAR